MSKNSPEMICSRSPSEQRSFCDRSSSGSTQVKDASSTVAPAMLQKCPPASICNNRSLNILQELNRIYEDRLADIDQQTNGNHELKYLTYKEWVEMLLKLMRDLIDVVQELEYEASCRIDLLEKKLQSESSSTCNNTDVGKLKNDVSNLVELIRRAIQEGSWNMDDLNFCTIKLHDIFGPNLELTESSSAQTCILDSPRKMTANDAKKLNSELLCKNHEIKRLQSEKHTLFNEVQCKDLMLANYSARIKELEKASKYPRCAKKSFPCLQESSLTGTEEDEVFKACITELKDCLKNKELQLAEKLKQNECLETELRLYKTQAMQKDKAIANMRALAYEVADKHDQIIQLRDQANSLEEELKKAHKKVQFKDNVIRELRREIKNSTKHEDTPRTSCIYTSDRTIGSDTENKSFKSVTFNDLEFTHRSGCAMSTATDKAMAQLGNSVRGDDERFIQNLKQELDELLGYQSCHCAAIEDQKRIMVSQHARLRDLIYKMLNDLEKNHNKLYFIRKRLLEIVCNNDKTSHYSPKQLDSGYVSPEDMETECHIIDTVQHRINEIRVENENLREQIKKSNTDMMSRNSSGYDRCYQCGNSEKLLREVASTLSNICGHEVASEIIAEPIEERDGQLHPICQAMLCLENELNDKNKSLCESQKMLQARDGEVKRLQEALYQFEEECNSKNCQIEELRNAVETHINSIERLKCAKDHVDAELVSLKKMTDNDEYKILFEAKQKLEVEICTDLGHDVLSEQLLGMFMESMRSERMLIMLRDENLALKELLVDAECDLRDLERRYFSISQTYCRSNEIQKEFQQLKERTKQHQPDIESRVGGESLYANCIRQMRCKMEKEYQRRLCEQDTKYREIIDDLNNELATLSDQVQSTQNELNREELAHFDASFRELEDQNERLQQTIQDMERKVVEYEAVTKNYRCEVQQLQSQNKTTMNVLKDKDAKYRDLADHFQQLTRTLKSVGSRCACGVNKVVQTVLVKAESVCVYLEGEKDNTIALFNEYTQAQISTTSFQMNEQMKELHSKINILEKTLEQRDHELREANDRLLRYAQKNGELTSELYMAQDQVFRLKAEDHRLKMMVDRMNNELKEVRIGRKERETSLLAEMNRLRQSMDEHAKALSTANNTIQMLERERRELQQQTDATNKENTIIKAELFKLKECTATHAGIEQGLRSQLLQTQSEITLLKCDLERFTCLRHDIENLKKNCARLKDANHDLVRKYNDLVEEYNNLEEEYRKLVEIKEQLFTELENSRSWQKQQKQQDELIETKFRKLEEHIDSLLEDRRKLIMKIGELHRDSILITGELDKFKDLCSGTFRMMSSLIKYDESQGNCHKPVQFGKMNCNVPPTDPKS